MSFSRFAYSLLILLFATSSAVWAQDGAESLSDDNFDVEQVLEQEEKKVEARDKSQRNQEKVKQRDLPQVDSVSKLAELAPFEDVAVIQRRFLPRTKRFEFAASGMGGLNNPFFNSLGVNLRGAYFLSERWGVEVMGLFFNNVARDVTVNLRDKRSVDTANIVNAKAFLVLPSNGLPCTEKLRS